MKACRAFLSAFAVLPVVLITISALRSQGTTALRPYPGIVLPTELKFVDPEYTQAARDAGIEGIVVLEAVIDPAGKVADPRVVQSLDTKYGLDEQAIAAAKKWLFHPATKDGKPVPVIVQLELMFRLSKNPAESSGFYRPVVVTAPQDRTRIKLPDDGFAAGAVAVDTPGLVKPVEKQFVEPKYTSAALRAKIHGTAVVEAIVGVDGTVTNARIYESLDKQYGLDDEAVAAVKKWILTPGKLSGKPVPVYTRFEVMFRCSPCSEP
jgi:TonB family protein